MYGGLNFEDQTAVNIPNTDAEAEAQALESTESQTNMIKDGLAADLHDEWYRRKEARREIEDEWLASLQSIKGEHSADTISRMNENGQLSRLFIKITLTKVNAAYSRLTDMLFSQIDAFWDVVPSPMPELPKSIKMMLKQQAKQLAMVEAYKAPISAEEKMQVLGQLEESLYERLCDAIKTDALENAEKSCTTIKRQIKNYLIEANALKSLKKTLRDMTDLGTGCFKIATVKFMEREGWEADESGKWDLQAQKEIMPDIEHCSIWEMYPNNWSTDVEDPEDPIRRRVLTRHELRKLADAPVFDAEAIGEILDQIPNGNHEDLEWERQLRNLNDSDERYHNASKRYDVFEYWGLIDGADLNKYGVQADDPFLEYQANIWFCENKVIMARLNPMKPETIPYKFVPYQIVAHRFWGIGIPYMMSDSEKAMNAAVNALLDNVALTAGPMLDIDIARLPESVTMEEAKKIYPFKVNFYDSSRGGEGPAVKVNNIQSNQTQLQAVFEMFRRFADEETSLPSYTHGEQTDSMNKTARGMSMLMNAANIALKSVVKNIDDYLTKPLIDSLYNFTMRWSDIEEKRGDLDVVPQGSGALIAKEMHSEKMMQVMSFTGNPVDGPMTNRRYLLEEYMRANNIDPEKALVSQEQTDATANGQIDSGIIAGPETQRALPSADQVPDNQPQGNQQPPYSQQ